MSERAMADIFLVLFYLAIFYGIFRYVKNRRHPQRPQWKSFGIVIGCLLLALTASVAFLFLVNALIGLSRNDVTTAFGVGVVAFSVINAWRWSMAHIKSPNV